MALSRLRSLDGLVLTSQISGSGIRQDQNVALFSKNKQLQEQLDEQIKRESEAFLSSYLLQCFDLNPLDNFVYEHVHSYSKDINKSAKQKHVKWAQLLLKDLSEIKQHANKFLLQIQRLSHVQSEDGLALLLERTKAAENYFNPLILELSARIFERMELVKQDKQVTAFLTELLEMESLFYEQYKKMRKATALLQSTISGKDFTKSDVVQLLNQAERELQMKKVFAMPNQLDFNAKKSRSTKAKVAKEPKADTKEASLELFLKGKSIEDIASERKMVVGTIEGHLAHYVAKQELSAKDILGSKKLDKILKAIKELQSMSLNNLRTHLGKDFTFGEIKIGIAAHLAEGG